MTIGIEESSLLKITIILDKDKNLISNTHLYIDKVTNSLEKFQYNVAVAQIREFSNLFLSYKVKIESKETLIAFKFSLTKWVILISPMVPHLAEELWKKLGYDTLVCFQKWPIAKLKYIQNKNINIVVQVNGKEISFINSKDLTENQTQDLLMKREDVKSLVGDKKVRKIFIVPNRIFSLVL